MSIFLGILSSKIRTSSTITINIIYHFFTLRNSIVLVKDSFFKNILPLIWVLCQVGLTFRYQFRLRFPFLLAKAIDHPFRRGHPLRLNPLLYTNELFWK
jgi:hypothetical protein